MKVTFDPDIRIAGIGMVPWTRLGPEQWLPQYAIASLYGWDLPVGPDVPRVIALSDKGTLPALSRINTQALLRNEAFQSLLTDELADYDLLTYKPVDVPPQLAGRKFLMVDESFTESYENKVIFRQKFGDRLRFPEFTVYNREKLQDNPEYFALLLNGRDGIVIQDERLSGGKGTFVIRQYEEYQAALRMLSALPGDRRVVVSSLVKDAKERSIQCCVTKDSVFTGPLQRQLVRDPLLANMAVSDGDKFCGAQIGASDQDTPLHRQAATIATEIGEALKLEGYRGIYGVDFLLDDQDELFTLEVNPRITGVTPLLTSLYRGDEGVPFYLLHLLELGGYEYTVTDTSATFTKDGSLLILHSLADEAVTITDMPASGTYTVANGQLTRVRGSIQMAALRPEEFILQEYMPPRMTIKPGGRLATLTFRRPVIDTLTDKLYNDVVKTISIIHSNITTKTVE